MQRGEMAPFGVRWSRLRFDKSACLPSCERRASRAAREREAKCYWDSLTAQQEAWALRKLGFHAMGRRID